MRSLLGSLVLCAALIAAAAWPGLAFAQDGGPLDRIASDRTLIRAQVAASVTYAEQAVAALDRADGPGLASAKRLAWESYRMMRYAVHGITALYAGKPAVLVDPLLQLAADKLWRAGELNATARADIDRAALQGNERSAYSASASEQLDQALHVAREAAELF
jgi:hypothetical protein